MQCLVSAPKAVSIGIYSKQHFLQTKAVLVPAPPIATPCYVLHSWELGLLTARESDKVFIR